MRFKPLIERFESRYIPEPNTGCWIWIGSAVRIRDKVEYGKFGLIGGRNGKQTWAHRFAYEFLVGPIPDGLTIDHLCRFTLCVNPRHLEPVTSKVNTLRGNSTSAIHARATHCSHGHPFSEENTCITPSGARQCRACRRAASLRTHYKDRDRLNADRRNRYYAKKRRLNADQGIV